jgi:hypothetical protein
MKVTLLCAAAALAVVASARPSDTVSQDVSAFRGTIERIDAAQARPSLLR